MNVEDGVKNLLEFMETKVFYNDPMTDRYKLWQYITKIMRDKHRTMTAYIYEAEAVLRRAEDVKLVLPKDIQGLLILEGAKFEQHHKQLVATGCNFECKDPLTEAPRLYEEIVAELQKVAGQHQALTRL